MMLNRISIKGPACYKHEVVIETDKQVNLIYGLNGSGKSTLAEYLRNIKDEKYSQCSVSPNIDVENEEILVYDEQFVKDTFYEAPEQNGIFSLSKGNAKAANLIDNANDEIKKLSEIKKSKKEHIDTRKKEFDDDYESFTSKTWNIKKEYEGTILDYCLAGVKNSHATLFSKLISISKDDIITTTIEQLQKDISDLEDANGVPIPLIPEIEFNTNLIEEAPIFKDVITGNKNSRVAKLIDQLGNSDWVKKGLDEYTESNRCPFCQREYNDSNILKQLKEYFSLDYQKAIDKVGEMGSRYHQLKDQIPIINSFDNVPQIISLRQEYLDARKKLNDTIDENIEKMRDKYKNPSITINLIKTSSQLKEVNDVIIKANDIIKIFNQKIKHVKSERDRITKDFWQIQRIKYDQTVSDYERKQKLYNNKITELDREVQDIDKQIKEQKDIIQRERKNFVSIDDAVDNINRTLQDIGITEFNVKKSNNNGMYCIERGEYDEGIFKTLSEGERMLISFLYFIEMCKGQTSDKLDPKSRVIVIDDPISSLSNMYIFNIAELLKEQLYPNVTNLKKETPPIIKCKSYCDQLFIMTHSLYFFYEMAEKKKERHDAYQKFFRLYKNENGTDLKEMKYEEIQNDYQAYWSIIKDNNSPMALVANCMRNAIEYFFGFIDRTNLDAIFGREALKDNRFQAFKRYINRESHSEAQNLYDYKEFDRTIFEEAFRLVYVLEGYENHYNRMMH